jgi:hypothetical protein
VEFREIYFYHKQRPIGVEDISSMRRWMIILRLVLLLISTLMTALKGTPEIDGGR